MLLIAGLFHSMHNATANSTGLVAVVALPQFEVLLIMAGCPGLLEPTTAAHPLRGRVRA